ncbi:unnamed protein product [Effrenium voratum]|nr:unnamed protein product [Effrenium voratum]
MQSKSHTNLCGFVCKWTASPGMSSRLLFNQPQYFLGHTTTHLKANFTSLDAIFLPNKASRKLERRARKLAAQVVEEEPAATASRKCMFAVSMLPAKACLLWLTNGLPALLQ